MLFKSPNIHEVVESEEISESFKIENNNCGAFTNHFCEQYEHLTFLYHFVSSMLSQCLRDSNNC